MVLAALVVVRCGRSGRTNAPARPVRIALTNVPLAYLPVIVANELGYYRQEGLSVTLDEFSSAARVLQSVLAGSADIAAGGYEQEIQMAAEGRRVKSFVLMLREPTRVVVAAPARAKAIRRIEELKGAVVGVAALGSINNLFLNYVLLKHGVLPEQVKIVSIGTGASAIAAIEHGRVDAAVLGGSETEIAMKRFPGMAMLLDARGASGARNLYGADTYPTAVLSATEGWLAQNPENARRVAHCIQKALTWIAGHSAEQTLALLPERDRMADRDAELKALLKIAPSFSRDGMMPADGAEAVRKALAFTTDKVRNAQFDISQTYTNEFVQDSKEIDAR
jgi:NitT/TauT family transport system substrate-binding protein